MALVSNMMVKAHFHHSFGFARILQTELSLSEVLLALKLDQRDFMSTCSTDEKKEGC